ETRTGTSVSPCGAGPPIRDPSASLKVDRWAGQVMTPSSGGPTSTPWCGQAASYARNVPSEGWATTTPPATTPPPTGTSDVAARTSPPAPPALSLALPPDGEDSSPPEEQAASTAATAAPPIPARTLRRAGHGNEVCPTVSAGRRVCVMSGS